MAQMGRAARTSKTECCFRNTVDREIRAAMTVNVIRHSGVLKCRLCQAHRATATEPITWIDGQTLVLVFAVIRAAILLLGSAVKMNIGNAVCPHTRPL